MIKSPRLIVSVFCFVFICLLPELGQAEELELRVIVQKANIRFSPDARSEIIVQVALGSVLKSDIREGNWYRVILPPDENGIERGGYIHSNIVEVITKPIKPLKEPTKEPVKEAPKIVEKDIVEKSKELVTIPEDRELPKVKTGSFLSRFLKRFSLKLSGGPGFFLNGAGDLEKLRTETMDYITAKGEPPSAENWLNRYKRDTLDGVPSYESEFLWDPFSINTHFQFGLNFDLSKNFSIGFSSGFFSARNEDIQYSHGYELSGEDEFGTRTETESTSYLEDYSLSATNWFLNFSYSSNPLNTPGRFSPEFSIGVGPSFARIEHTFIEEQVDNKDWTCPYLGESWDHEWTTTTISGDWRAWTLGARISGGIDWNVFPWMTIGLDGFLLLANFNNWKGTEVGNREWGYQLGADEAGGIYEDDSDSETWEYGPDVPLYYYTGPGGQPSMSLMEIPPENGLPPSINWNTWGIEATIKIGLGGGEKTPPVKTRERKPVPPVKPIEIDPGGLYFAEPPKCEPCEEECLEFTVGMGIHISITRGTLFTDVPVCRIESAAGPTIDFWLHYDSGKADGSVAARRTVLGYGWTHNYNIYIVDESPNVFLSDGEGRMTRFRRQNGSFVADPGETHELKQPDADTFLVKEVDGTIRIFKRSAQPPWNVAGEFYPLTEIMEVQGRITTLTYDRSGRLRAITGPFGHQVTLNYKGNSSLLSTVRNVDGAVTKIHYTGEDLSRVTDPLGHTLEYTYDNKHRMLTEKKKDGSTWTCVYNSAGKPYQLIDKDFEVLATVANSGNWTVDQNQLLQSRAVVYLPGKVAVTDGEGNTTYCTYNENGYIVGIQRPDAEEMTYQYNGNLRLSARTDEEGNTWHYERDQCGNATRITDPLGNESHMFYEHNFKNLITKKIEPDGDVWLYEYDSHGNLTREIDPIVESPLDRVMTHTYNAQGLRTSTDDRNGHRTQWEYNPDGTLFTQIIDPWDLAITKAFRYDPAGRMQEEIMYRGPNFTDPVITRYIHDGMGQIISRTVDTDGLNLKTQYRYDGEGRVILQINPRGISTEYQYDVRGQLILQIVDPGGLHLVTERWYDGAGNLIKLKDPQGYEIQNSYDCRNRLIKIIDAKGYWTLYEYDQRGNHTFVKRSINPGGPPYQITQYSYDELSRLTHEILNPSGLALSTEFEYAIPGSSGCACGTPGSSLVHKTIDAMGKVTYQYYDPLDRLTHIVRKVRDTEDNGGDADDAVTRYEYDFMGNRTKVTVENAPDPDMVVTYTYDAADRITEEVNGPAGSRLVTTNVYDGAGNVIQTTTPLGNVITTVYDQANRLIEQSDTIGMIARFAYDENGNILTQTDGFGRTLKYIYDSLDRLIALYDPLVEIPSDKYMIYMYDKNSNLIQQTDNEGLITRYSYDSLGRQLAETRDPGGLDITITRAYDGLNNMTKITDDNCNPTRYEYDSAGRRVREIYADGTDVQFVLDASGDLIKKMDQMDNITAYTYDDLHRLTGIYYANGNADTFTYDRVGNLLSAVNNHSHIGLAYDDVGRIVSSTQTDQPQTYSHRVRYTYGLSPNQRTIQYPSGEVVKELIDVRGRLVELSVDGVKTTWYDYENPSNRVLAKNFANGTKAEYVYNDNDWITGLRHIGPDGRTFAGFAHDYDAVGNPINAINLQNVLPYNDAKPTTESEMYSYDSIYRLVGFKRGVPVGGNIPLPTSDRTWQLDGVHNWTQFDIDNNSYANSVNQMNEYDDFSTDGKGAIPDDDNMPDDFMLDQSASGRNFAHDKNGNLVSDDVCEYYYDYEHRQMATAALRAENRLTKIKDKATGDSLGEYFYDALGRRIKKQAGGVSTIYVYTYNWRAIEEYENGSLARSYAYGQWIDEVLTMDRTIEGDRLYYHTNALGSTISLSDSAGLPVEGYIYDAYGLPVFFDSSGIPMAESASGNSYLFQGRRYDKETELYNFRNRYFYPQTGRFIQHDPVWDPNNIGNQYTFVGNNPASRIDPMGLEFVRLGWKWSGKIPKSPKGSAPGGQTMVYYNAQISCSCVDGRLVLSVDYEGIQTRILISDKLKYHKDRFDAKGRDRPVGIYGHERMHEDAIEAAYNESRTGGKLQAIMTEIANVSAVYSKAECKKWTDKYTGELLKELKKIIDIASGHGGPGQPAEGVMIFPPGGLPPEISKKELERQNILLKRGKFEKYPVPTFKWK